MADQKTEDTKSPLPRRAARPFAGPTGASTAAPAFVRPATTKRPTAAPFIPPVLPGKVALGSVAPAPTVKAPTPVVTQSVSSADADASVPPSRPVTTEMVALEAMDVFDAVWADDIPAANDIGPANDDMAAEQPEEHSTPITIEPAQVAPAGSLPAWLEDEAAPVPAPAPSAFDSELTSPASDVAPAWSVTDPQGGYAIGEWTDMGTIPTSDEIVGVPPEPTKEQEPEAELLPSLGDMTPASAVQSADEVLDAADAQPRFELVEEPPVEASEPPPVTALAAAAYSPHDPRIAAALDRLADRVRSGEIHVSSIAPDATDAAVLASVLAALLGGSSSR